MSVDERLGFDPDCLCPGCTYAAVEAQKYDPEYRALLLREISDPDLYLPGFAEGRRIAVHVQQLIARAGDRFDKRQDEATEHAMALLVVAYHQLHDEGGSEAVVHERIDAAIRAFAKGQVS